MKTHKPPKSLVGVKSVIARASNLGQEDALVDRRTPHAKEAAGKWRHGVRFGACFSPAYKVVFAVV